MPVEELQLSAEEMAELTSVAQEQAAAPAAAASGDDELVLEQLSILGSAAQIPRIGGSATVIDEDALSRMERDDIHRVLEAAPGVYVRGEDGFGLRPNIGIRGASSERSAKVTLMEDGVLFGPAPYSAPAAYYFPMVTRMTAVEVFKGPAGIRYGPQTIGGALNMITRPVPELARGSIDLAAGQYRAGKVHGHWGRHFGNFGVLLEGVHLQSDGFKELDGGGGTGFDKNETMAKLRYRSAPDAHVYHQLDLKLGYADEVSQETYLGLSRADFEDSPLRRYRASALDEMDWWRTQLQLSYLVSVGESFSVRAAFYRHDYDRVWNRLNRFGDGRSLSSVLDSPDQGTDAVYYGVLTGADDSMSVTFDDSLLVIANDRRFVSQGVQTTADWAFATGPLAHALQMGARLHHDRIERDQRETGYLMQRGVLVPDGQERAPVTLNEASAVATALHLQDEIGVGALHVTPGLRLELIDTRLQDELADVERERFDAIWIPGIGAHYGITPQLGVLAGVHKGFSPVAPGQRDEVKPEDSTNYEAGARLTTEHVDAELIGFFNDYDNLLAMCTFAACGPVATDQQFNAGRVFVYGLEAVTGLEVPAGGNHVLGFDASYTMTLSSFRGDATGFPLYGDVEKGDELPYVPKHTLSATVRAESPDYALSAGVRYAAAMRAEAGQGDFEGREGGEQHVIVDLGARYFPYPSDHIYLTIENLLDASYMASNRPFGARPGKPLQIMLGYRHDFEPPG